MSNKVKKVICKDIDGKEYEVSTDQLTFRPSVYAIIIRNGKILLSKQWGLYAFPGGGVNIEETLENALIREVREEVGLDIKIGKVVDVQESFFKLPYDKSFVHAVLIYYICEIKDGELSTSLLDEYEKEYAGEPEWVSLSHPEEIKFKNTVDCTAVLLKAKKIVQEIH